MSERRYLMENRKPPPNWKVLLAECMEAHGARSQVWHVGVGRYKADYEGQVKANMQTTTICFGKLLTHTFSTNSDLDFDIEQYGAMLQLQPIWPAAKRQLRRPNFPHSDEKAFFVGEAFKTLALIPNLSVL